MHIGRMLLQPFGVKCKDQLVLLYSPYTGFGGGASRATQKIAAGIIFHIDGIRKRIHSRIFVDRRFGLRPKDRTECPIERIG